MDYTELDLRSYSFDPVKQAAIIPGAIEKGLGYSHKANDKLTTSEQTDIINEVEGLTPYI